MCVNVSLNLFSSHQQNLQNPFIKIIDKENMHEKICSKKKNSDKKHIEANLKIMNRLQSHLLNQG